MKSLGYLVGFLIGAALVCGIAAIWTVDGELAENWAQTAAVFGFLGVVGLICLTSGD